MSRKAYRWFKKVLLVTAALPLYQSACAANEFFFQDFSQNLAFGLFGSITRGVQSTLMSFFPSADLLQMLLGGNTQGPFTG